MKQNMVKYHQHENPQRLAQAAVHLFDQQAAVQKFQLSSLLSAH